MKIYKLCLFLTTILFADAATAQSTGKQVTRQDLVWLSYANTIKFSSKWSLTSEAHTRRFIKPSVDHQFVLRSQARYALGENWEAVAGFTYFLQSPNDPRSIEKLAVPELRPHIQFNYNQPLGKLTVTHRYRAEKRFFRNVANGELADGYTSNYRFRYRLGLDYHIADVNEQPLKLKVNNELLVNAGNNIIYNRFDQNRLYGGINYAISNSIEVEAGYLHWYQQRSAGNQFYSRHIANVVVYHRIDLSKRKDAESK